MRAPPRLAAKVFVPFILAIAAASCGDEAAPNRAPVQSATDGGAAPAPNGTPAVADGAAPPAAAPDGGHVPDAGPGDAGPKTPEGLLAQRLGRDHFLIGLGPSESRFPTTAKLDVKYTYLVGASDPANAWPKYNQPDGQWATMSAEAARAHGAIPMFDIYEFAALGDGNFLIVRNNEYMRRFWADVQLLADHLQRFNAPAIVHIEPDFWGYAQMNSPGGDPTKFQASVKISPKCADLPDDLTGLGRCAIRILHTTAPKAIVGLHASAFGAFDASGKSDPRAIGKFVRQCSGGEADFVGTDIGDRDAGCFEAKPSQFDCGRGGTTGWYWDETNRTSPNFREYFVWAKAMRDAVGVPVMWWQVPMGVPSATAGGAPNQYRDNRVKYFFSHMDELVAAGGFAVSFGAGAKGQTTIDTDGGQFERALTAYNANPVRLR